MTAVPEVRARVERLSLVARLERLAGRVRAVVDGGGSAAGFAQAVLGQLAPALADARIQSDQAEILLSEAADRELLRESLQKSGKDLRYLMELVDAMDSGALSKSWLLDHLAALACTVDAAMNPANSRKPSGFPMLTIEKDC